MSVLKELDWVVLLAILFLALLSLAALYPFSVLNNVNYFWRQLIFYLIAFGVVIGLSFLNVSFLKKQRGLILILYGIGLALLILVLIFSENIRGAASWITFVPGKAGFEPAELMRILVIFILARYFTVKRLDIHKFSSIILSALYAGIPAVFILLQPDLGAAIVFFLLWFGIVIMAGIRWQHLFLIVLVIVVGTGLLWNFGLKPYQKVRVISFLNPASDPLGANYSRNQSIIAIGAGGLWGRGFGNNVHSLDGFLPEAHNDFMFATLTESLGLSGVAIIFALYGTIIYRLLTFEGKHNFDRLYASSLGLLIFIEAAINIAIALGLLPVTGLTLPFLSYGGSSIISLCIGLGIYQALYVKS